LEVGAEGGFKLDLRQDCDPGKWRLKGAVRIETYRRHYCQQVQVEVLRETYNKTGLGLNSSVTKSHSFGLKVK
jgi:hypothetical protein